MDIKNFKTYTNESGFNTPTNLLCKLCPKDVESGGTCSFFAEGNNPGCLKEDYYIECTYDVVANRDSGGTIINFPVTKLYNSLDGIKATAMTIDDRESVSPTTGYTFDTEGEHVVKFYKGSKFTSLSTYSFSSCPSLVSVKGLQNITTIGVSTTPSFAAFSMCTKLKSVDLSEKCEFLGLFTFSGCTSLEKIGSLKKVVEIRDTGVPRTGAFQGCRSINQDIHLNISEIRYYCFSGCTNLHDVYIDNCTRIQYHAFDHCENMHAIYMMQTIPPVTQYENGIGSFDTTGNCPIYVPEESVQAYKTATNWTRYASRIKPMKKYR